MVALGHQGFNNLARGIVSVDDQGEAVAQLLKIQEVDHQDQFIQKGFGIPVAKTNPS